MSKIFKTLWTVNERRLAVTSLTVPAREIIYVSIKSFFVYRPDIRRLRYLSVFWMTYARCESLAGCWPCFTSVRNRFFRSKARHLFLMWTTPTKRYRVLVGASTDPYRYFYLYLSQYHGLWPVLILGNALRSRQNLPPQMGLYNPKLFYWLMLRTNNEESMTYRKIDTLQPLITLKPA